MGSNDDRPPDVAPDDSAEAMAKRGEWAAAYRALAEGDRGGALNGAGLERLGEAAYMLGRETEFVEAFERAFDDHRRNGMILRAARCAFWIGLTLIFRGECGRGSGWLRKSDRLLDGHDSDCAEHGYLMLPKVEQCLASGDFEGAYEHAARAAEIGERHDDEDLLCIARHLQGRIMIESGDQSSGLALLDEAMVAVTANQLSPIVTGLIYCSVIEACQKFHAINRAREWTAALTGWCSKQPEIVAFTGRCLIHRAQILIYDGHWIEAEREAVAATIRLKQGPAEHHAGPALYQEGEVHRLRGRFDKADDAYRAASRLGFDPQPGLALMRLEQGRGQSALSAIRRALHSAEGAASKLRLLPAAVEITLAAGSTEDARAYCDMLRGCAAQYSAESVRASVDEALAQIRIAEGLTEDALACVRRAADRLRDLQAPYHLARLRLLTARVYLAIGDVEGAQTELEAALGVFRDLGARPDETRTSKMLARLTKSGDTALTSRQAQVLQLIADGMTNPAIADSLGLSERTVDRHVSNILTRLNVPTRAAATAYALSHGLIDTGRAG